jgi:hypothetical protein
VIYNVKVLSLSWYADSCSPYNRFINVYMIIYIWKGSISVNIQVVSWMGIHHFHRKQVYTFNVFALHLITLSKPSTQILTKAISSIGRFEVIQVFSIIVITRYRQWKLLVSFKPSPQWDATTTTAIHVKLTRNKNISVYD